MAIFTGAGVALITPMKPNGDVNFERLEELVNYQIDNGTDAIISCGTTGEASTLTHEEHLDVIKACVQYADKRVPVIAGTGSNCTRTAIYLSQEAEKRGADGLLVVTPYYNKGTQKGMAAHFKAIADSVKVPVILYNIPGRTGCSLASETVAGLFREVENIVGVKEASGNFKEIANLMYLTDGRIDLYSGNDEQIVPVMSLGGKGVISVLSHVVPGETHDMVVKYLAGDVEGSRALQLKYMPLINALFSEVNPIPVKKAVSLMGMEAGPLRMPLSEMEDSHAKVLEEEMRKLGIIK